MEKIRIVTSLILGCSVLITAFYSILFYINTIKFYKLGRDHHPLAINSYKEPEKLKLKRLLRRLGGSLFVVFLMLMILLLTNYLQCGQLSVCS